MLSDYDRYRLEQYGFTRWEVDELDRARDPAGNPQHTNLDDPVWQDAMEEHNRVKMAFYDMYPGASNSDYTKFMNNWFMQEVGSFDPWIWIDQNYFRTHFGLSKGRWNDAYNKIQGLKQQLMMD